MKHIYSSPMCKNGEAVKPLYSSSH